MEEKFETIKGFGAKYIVSNFGRVFSNNGKELKPGTNNCGYKYVILCNKGTRKKMYVHRLVADAFVDKLGNLVKQWPSVREIERVLGFRHSSISACCRGENAMAYNFKWEYANG